LLSSLTLGLIFWLWQPIPTTLWNVQATWAQWLLWGGFALGWILVYISAQMINSGHFFGMQQVKEYYQDKKPTSPKFQTPGLYRYLRHPLMVGFLVAFWVTPHMTLGHLLFAVVTTSYIFIAVRFEERDLARKFGDRYRAYRERVPMWIPKLNAKS
jgi:protein-S-isoprenylcysteine O-methyltransferase Ste14